MRLIDADELLRKLQEQQKYSSTTDIRGRSKSILEVIHAPTISVQPVKHGEWNSESSYYVACSCCNYHLTRDEWFSGCDWNYCPQCGAKMDGED